MNKDRDEIVEALREQGQHDRAAQAESLLPKEVDTERDAHTLREQFDVSEGELPED